MEEWIEIDEEAHGFYFAMPTSTTNGQKVEVLEKQHNGIFGRHALTPDRHTVYFEVVAYPHHIDHANTYANQAQHIAQNFDEAVIGEPSATQFQQLPATVFSFDSKNFGRRFLLVDTDARSYRIVYDHLYPLNEQILETLKLI